MERSQFTFYRSFAEAIRRIRKKSDRADAYDAIVGYALYETVPELERISPAAAIAFEMARPVLDSARKKARAGQLGGLQANGKQSESKKERETEKEIEYQYKTENDWSSPAPSEADYEAMRQRALRSLRGHTY